jgi:hypothetical protein
MWEDFSAEFSRYGGTTRPAIAEISGVLVGSSAARKFGMGKYLIEITAGTMANQQPSLAQSPCLCHQETTIALASCARLMWKALPYRPGGHRL